jgi:hypothetical protein
VVRLLHDLNYLSLDVQYIDGTKIESAANIPLYGKEP